MSCVIRTYDPKQYEIKEVLALVAAVVVPRRWSWCNKVFMVLDGEEIKVTDRLRTYLKGVVCVTCGIKGRYFKKTRQSDQSRPHLNLYAINKHGHEVLMTSDHIMPKSRGGKDSLENRQAMCATCNTEKGNKLPDEIKTRSNSDSECVL